MSQAQLYHHFAFGYSLCFQPRYATGMHVRGPPAANIFHFSANEYFPPVFVQGATLLIHLIDPSHPTSQHCQSADCGFSRRPEILTVTQSVFTICVLLSESAEEGQLQLETVMFPTCDTDVQLIEYRIQAHTD